MTEPSRVVVAHADADRVLVGRASLESDGYLVVTATSGEEVRSRLTEEAPTVVLLDVELAAADGWSLLGAITADERTREVPVVLLVDEDDDRDPARAWDAGATEVVAGPLGPLALSQVVRDVLDTSPQERRDRRALVDAARRGFLPG